MSVFKDVAKLYEKFNIPFETRIPHLLEESLMHGRIDFLEEEFQETILAYAEDNLEETIDGLIDLIYVAVGTLHLMGVSSQAHWDEVQRANMDKVPGKKPGRSMQYDMFKPADWEPPHHKQILEETCKNK